MVSLDVKQHVYLLYRHQAHRPHLEHVLDGARGFRFHCLDVSLALPFFPHFLVSPVLISTLTSLDLRLAGNLKFYSLTLMEECVELASNVRGEEKSKTSKLSRLRKRNVMQELQHYVYLPAHLTECVIRFF